MSPWRLRLALRRARVQFGLLAVVLLVSVVAATLVATLYLLDFTTTAHAANEGMATVPLAQRQLTHTVVPAGSIDDVIDGSDRAAHQGLDPLQFDRNVSAEGALQVARFGDEDDYVLGYLGYTDDAADQVAIIDGRWPQDSVGPVEVVVPAVMLTDLDRRVGDTLRLGASTSDDNGVEVRVVGSYLPIDAGSDYWKADRFAASGLASAAPVPGPPGLTATAYGPLLATVNGVDVTATSRVTIVYTPKFADASLAQMSPLPSKLAAAETALARQLGPAASRVTVQAPVAGSIGTITTSLAMTRSSVIVSGLLLLVVAVAALTQAAKLVGERRQTESHLMAARGASGAQSLFVGTLEAIALGAITVAAAVPAARLTFRTLARLPLLARAGFEGDPGLPLGAWIAAGSVGLLLCILVSAPLVRRSHTLVEAAPQRVRPGRAGVQKAGIDVALLAVAGLAFWQLTAYTPPVAAVGAAPRLDPLLTAAPALALLAGALAVTRIVPAASRLLDLIASRGRRAVLPLAAWQVSRRPAKAASAIMLLTLAVSVGTFGLGYLSTWTASQRDQSLYLHPQDAIAKAPSLGWSVQREAVTSPGVEVTPAVIDSGELSAQSLSLMSLNNEPFSGAPIYLLATDALGWASLGGGRLDEVDGGSLRASLTTQAVAASPGAALPAGSQGVAFTVSAAPSVEELTDVVVSLRALVQTGDGDLLTIDLGIVAADGSPHRVTGSLAGATGAVTLVGLQATIISTGDANVQAEELDNPKVSVDVTLAQASGVKALPWWSVEGVRTPDVATPFSLDPVAGWASDATGGVVDGATVTTGDATLHLSSNIGVLQDRSLMAAVTAAPLVTTVPIVATDAAIGRSRLASGDEATLRVGRTTVPATLVNTVPLVAGRQGAVVAADRDSLQLALFQHGGKTEPTQEWWVSTDDAVAYAAAVPQGVTVSTRQAQVEALTTGPLRVSIPTAVWMVIAAAAVLAAIGFAVHVVVSTRSRQLELAQLRAVGLSRGRLVRMLSTETLVLALLGSTCGLGLGVGLVTLIAPLLALGPTGGPPQPAVQVVIPWEALGGLAGEVAVVALIALAIVVVLTRRIDTATLLRQGQTP